MLPVVAIVGRPNVGKSTLFNGLTHSRDALVADIPGVTRDRQYGTCVWYDKKFLLVDTGGIYENQKDPFYNDVLQQARIAIREADLIVFVVDAQAGFVPADAEIAKELRKSNKPIYLAINKMDTVKDHEVQTEFLRLGFKHFHYLSAVHQRGIIELADVIVENLPSYEISSEENEQLGIKIAIAGRPNVGKSTLVNRILGEDRVIVCDHAGTTRDSIYIPFKRFEQSYTLIDTAGVRRRSRIDESLEKFSVIKTLQAIEDSHVVIFLIDAQENIVEQDLNMLSFILQSGKALVLAINKWDGLSNYQKEQIKSELDRRLPFMQFIRQFYISALHGTNVGHLFEAVDEAYTSAGKEISTHDVTEALLKAYKMHQPPSAQGRPIKLRYGHLGGHFPPVFVIHGNRTDMLPESYKRYLKNFFYQTFKLYGTAIKFEFKTGDNPFKGKKNELTERQKRKRKRLIRFSR